VSADGLSLRAVGRVVSSLTDRSSAPRQADEGAPSAVLELEHDYAPAARDLRPGDELLVLTWLHGADRSVLVTHPRGDPERPVTGVFSTRSPDRPNPIGIHRVRVSGVEGVRIHVDALEAIDGTPVLDIKPVLGRDR
jgi:tRNA-Thr(GGU) m(6)t(6)A37 methyltransferase TsaA